MLHAFLKGARSARRRRLRERHPIPAAGERDATQSIRRRRAALLLERLLCSRVSGDVDAPRYFGRLATRMQMASGVIGRMVTSVTFPTIGASHARMLASIIADLVNYAEDAVSSRGSITVYLAMAIEDGLLIVGIGIDGDINLVSTASASVAMQRARSIVELLRGDFQRGADGSRLVFGLTFGLWSARSPGS